MRVCRRLSADAEVASVAGPRPWRPHSPLQERDSPISVGVDGGALPLRRRGLRVTGASALLLSVALAAGLGAGAAVRGSSAALSCSGRVVTACGSLFSRSPAKFPSLPGLLRPRTEPVKGPGIAFLDGRECRLFLQFDLTCRSSWQPQYTEAPETRATASSSRSVSIHPRLASSRTTAISRVCRWER